MEISRCELLSREEENRLAKRVMEKNNEVASRRLVTANLRLVVKIAMDFQRYWTKNLLDLIQEGNLGLLRAVEKFDYYRGIKSFYYASFWIKAYILKFLMGNRKLVRTGTTQNQRKLFFKLAKERDRLVARGLFGREADIFDKRIMAEKPKTLRQLGDKYGISRERVRQVEGKIVSNAKKWLEDTIPNFDEDFADL